MSRILSAITVICLALTCVAQAEVSPDEAFFFVVEDGEATVVGVDADLVGPEIAVPTVLLGFPVTAIGGGAFEGEIKSIQLPASIERIGEAAFPAGAGLVVHAGSPAAEYAEANGFPFTYAEQSPDTPGSAEEIQAELSTCVAEADAIRMEIVGAQEDIWEVESSGDSTSIAALNEQLAALEDELAAVEERREQLEAELLALSASTGPAASVEPTAAPSESSELDIGEATVDDAPGIFESGLAPAVEILDGAQHRFDGVVQVSGSDASQSSSCAVSIDQAGLDEEGGLQILGGCNILREDGTYQEEEILVQINESGILASTPWLEYAQSAAPEGLEGAAAAVLATFREDGEAWSTLWGSLWEEMNAREGWLEEMDTVYSVDMAAFQCAFADVLSDMATDIPFLRILEGMRLMDAMSIPESQRRVAAMMLLKTLSSYVSEMEIPEDTTLSYRQEANGLSFSVAVGAAAPILTVECADDRLTVEIVPTGGWNVHFSRERGVDGWTDAFSARDAAGETEIIVEGNCIPGDEGSIYAYEAIACLNGMRYDVRTSWTATTIEAAPAERAKRSLVPAQAPETAQETDAATGATPTETAPEADAATGATTTDAPKTDAVTGATPSDVPNTDAVTGATPTVTPTPSSTVVMQKLVTPTLQPAPTPERAPTPEPTPKPTPRALRSATIRSLGEITVMPNLLQSAYTDTSYDFDPMFEYIEDVVGNADFTVGDVEGPMDNRPESPFSGSDPMNTPPKVMLSMRKAGVDMLTLANDHALDMLFDGLMRTIENCKNADSEGGMKYVGAAASQAEKDSPNIVEINGINVAFLNYTSTLNGKEKSASSDALKYGVNLVTKSSNVKSDVQKAREAGADVVIAYASWGDMMSAKPADDQELMAKAMVAAGVDVIIGFNPHTVQPAYWLTDEVTKHKTLCLFATGNFLSDVRNKGFDSGVIFEFTIQETEAGKFQIANPVYIPTWVWRYAKEGGTGYDYRVLAVGEWLDQRPDGMNDTDYARLKAVWTEVRDTMSMGNADARMS